MLPLSAIPITQTPSDDHRPETQHQSIELTQASLNTNIELVSSSRDTGESSLAQRTPASIERDFAVTGQPRRIDASEQKLWILACFRSSVFHTKAIHENVSGGRYDFQIFERFRAIYFAEKSWLRRFFELKEVRSIKFVMVCFSLYQKVSRMKTILTKLKV